MASVVSVDPSFLSRLAKFSVLSFVKGEGKIDRFQFIKENREEMRGRHHRSAFAPYIPSRLANPPVLSFG